MRSGASIVCVCLSFALTSAGEQDGLLHVAGKTLFLIGIYELPEGDAALQRMADSGINLFRCGNRAELDRVQASGAFGWVPLGVHQGATDALREQVNALQDHPALAVWEGPDEIVWNFTATSTLKDSAGITREDWVRQRPHAVAYAAQQAQQIMPAMHQGIALVRELDTYDRPFWMNEARDSDALYVRQYLDAVDVVGCDDYPVHALTRDMVRVLRATDRWTNLSRGKPVWMVLQAFSWHEIGKGEDPAWPSFDESRLMAYGVIAHGARGVLYWGSAYLRNESFRTSLYALTSELSALQPFLIAPEEPGVTVNLIEPDDRTSRYGVAHLARRAGTEWLVVLINQDDFAHLGTEVQGLTALGQRPLHLLYGEEVMTPDHLGSCITRLQAHEIKLFASDRKFETSQREGRDFIGG
ncbi:MAG: hypothetical protein HYZ00_00535 [Candidatus Hydrogenedentes bacterium]|nr:hypothetical protein [Candidatus Hydrogenedentota bacterium]